jgi:hypothetical protein
LLNFNKAPPSIDETTQRRSSPIKENLLNPTTRLKSPPQNLLTKLKTLITDKRISASPRDLNGKINSNFGEMATLNALPDTSTPTSTAPLCRTVRHRLFDTSRYQLKRHRLILPDESSDDSQKASDGGGQRRINCSDDDSLIAGLDLDAFLNDARQWRGSSNYSTPFKRNKTTGDLPYLDIRGNQKPNGKMKDATPVTVTRKEDAGPEDDFFLDAGVFEEIEKMEEEGKTQKIK